MLQNERYLCAWLSALPLIMMIIDEENRHKTVHCESAVVQLMVTNNAVLLCSYNVILYWYFKWAICKLPWSLQPHWSFLRFWQRPSQPPGLVWKVGKITSFHIHHIHIMQSTWRWSNFTWLPLYAHLLDNSQQWHTCSLCTMHQSEKRKTLDL